MACLELHLLFVRQTDRRTDGCHSDTALSPLLSPMACSLYVALCCFLFTVLGMGPRVPARHEIYQSSL